MDAMLSALMTNASSERGLDMYPVSTANLDGYACWCYFAENHGGGKGKPISKIDQSCKLLHDGYECAMMDTEVSGEEECIPWEVSYAPASEFTAEMLLASCASRNAGNTCGIYACTVESWFVTQIANILLGQLDLMREDYKHANGFDIKANCLTKTGVHSERSCCGNYPSRYPYKTYNGDRACCGSKTYDVSILMCCDDQHAKISCSN